MVTDTDRYTWLLSHMGFVEREAQRWNPVRHKPLLQHLHDYISQECAKESKKSIETQRKLLNDPGC